MTGRGVRGPRALQRHDHRGIGTFRYTLGRQAMDRLFHFLYSSVDMLTTECRLMTGPTHPLRTLVVRFRLVLTVLTPTSLQLGLSTWWTAKDLSSGDGLRSQRTSRAWCSRRSLRCPPRLCLRGVPLRAPQSLDAHPLQPQLTHWMSWSSFICSFGTRQMHVDLKFVSLVWMHRVQHNFS